jgi:ATP-dependent DNA helicase RecG
MNKPLVSNKHLERLQNDCGTESMMIEWKPSLSQTKEIIETISGFANTEGGKILIGITESGKVKGVEIGKGTVEELTNKNGQNTDPKVQPRITLEKIKNKDIIVIDVKESADKLVLAFGRPYKRIGKSTVRMSKDGYERRILEKHKDKLQFDTRICLKAVLKDIDRAKLSWFLRTAKAERNYDVDPDVSVKEGLKRLKLTEGERLTNSAILLFGKEPQGFFPQVKIRAGRFKGTDGLDFIDMKILDGTIPELREKAMKFIMEHIRHGVFFDANRRYDKWEYPLRALEEILNNALAHRDYFSNADIHLSIYDDRIEAWNPGELLPPLKPADLKKEHKSIPRNRFLADRLFLIKYIEQWGRGTNRIVNEMRENKLAEPEFKNYSGGFAVVLHGPGKSFEEEIEKEKLHILEINNRQKKAIKYIKERGSITRSEYMKINRISNKTANLELKYMLERKLIERESKGKYTKYYLKR